jgi:hypothetical protein
MKVNVIIVFLIVSVHGTQVTPDGSAILLYFGPYKRIQLEVNRVSRNVLNI